MRRQPTSGSAGESASLVMAMTLLVVVQEGTDF
jgi:hypothetical protein